MLVVREVRLKELDEILEKAMTVQKLGTKIFCRCIICDKQGHISKVGRSVLL